MMNNQAHSSITDLFALQTIFFLAYRGSSVHRMASPALRCKAATGFLTMIFLLPGTYALECYTFTSFQQFDSKGRCGFEHATVARNSTCSSGNDVCLSVEFELGTDENTLLVSYRGCFAKNPRDAEGATIFGHQYFAIQSNLSYCYQDFCNIRSASAEFPKTTSKGTETSHPNGSIHCYSGQNHNASELTLEKVACSNRSDLCYQGRHAIKVGNITQVFYIRSCQNPSCDVPKHRVFGPVELEFLEGSCCSGSNCNGKKGTSEVSNDIISRPTGGPYAGGAGSPTTNFTDSDGTSKEDSDYDTESDDDTVSEKTPNSPIHPRAPGPKSKGSSFQFCPLLLAIGMTVLELGW
ncbi:testis-expressed protein 101 [Pogona vitticeps]